MKPFDPRLLQAAPTARAPIAVLAAVGVLQGFATIALAFALSALAVAVVGHGDLGRPGSWTAALFVVRAGLAWVAERVAARAGVEVTSALRRALVVRWLSLPADDRPAPDAAVTLAAQGTATVEPYAARFLPALVHAAVVPVLALAALVWVDWLSALIVVLTLPLLPFFAALIGKTTQADTDRRWAALSALSGHFVDVMRGLPTLVTYGRAERQVDVIGEVSQRHRRATMRTLKLAFLSSAALELLASISVAIVAVTVGLRLTHGTIPLMTGLVAILLAPEAYWPIRRVGAEFHAAADGAEAIATLLPQLRPLDGVVPEYRGRSSVDVRAEGLSYTHPGAHRPVLTDLTLSAGPGLTVITGPSGAGKSTLLDLLAGIRRPTEGQVHTSRAHLVTQRPFLPAGTIRAALTVGGEAPDDALWSALRAVELDGFVAALPSALATSLGDEGFGLSAGQRARLAIARAILSDAPIQLLDEPTAHLDAHACEVVHSAITQLAQRHTVIVVTHRTELVALADHHVHLDPATEKVAR